MDKVHNADLTGPVALRAPWLAGNLLAGSIKIHTTVKCACVGRSSVGLHWPIEYTLTVLISATELITRYYSNEKLAQCCFNVRPTYATLADIKPTFGECAMLARKAITVNIYIYPQEVLLAQFSLYVHKGGLKPDSFYFIFLLSICWRSTVSRTPR